MEFEFNEAKIYALRDGIVDQLNSADESTPTKAFAILLVLKGLGVALDRAEGLEDSPLIDIKQRQLATPTLGGQCIIASESVREFLFTILEYQKTGVVPTPEQLLGELYGIKPRDAV